MRCYSKMIERGALDSLVVVMRNTHEHADVAAIGEIQDQAGVLDRFPGGLQKQPVLRIHIRRFPGRDSKKLRIELIDLAEKPASLGESFSGNPRFGIEVSL